MRAKRIWMVRHGQTEYNKHSRSLRVDAEGYNRIVRESEGSLLTAEGREQIEGIVEYFQGRPISAVHTSPLPRSLQSAEILAGGLDLPVICVDGFREFVPTAVRPLLFRGRDRTLRGWYLQSMARQFFPVFPVSESFWQARSRMKRAWREVVNWYPPDGTDGSAERLVLAHRGTVLILRWALWWDRRWRTVSSDVSNGGITEIIRR